MNFSSFRYGVIGKRSLVVLALGLAVACGDDAETAPEPGQDGSADGDAGSDTRDGSDADGSEGGDGSMGGDGASADGGDGQADGSGDGSEGPDLARGEFLFLRSCGTCHGAANPSLALSTAEGDVNLDAVKLNADKLLGRINSAERPMPPPFASGDQVLTAEEKALVIAYIESLSN